MKKTISVCVFAMVMSVLCNSAQAQQEEPVEPWQKEQAQRWFEEAQQHFRQGDTELAIMCMKLRANLDPNCLRWQLDAGRYLQLFGGDPNEIMDFYNKVIAQAKERYGEKNLWTAEAYLRYGDNYMSFANHPFGALQYADALRYYLYAENYFSELLGDENNLWVAESYNGMGAACTKLGNEKTLPYLEKALSILDSIPDNDTLLRCDLYTNLGLEHAANQQLDKAYDYYVMASPLLNDFYTRLNKPTPQFFACFEKFYVSFYQLSDLYTANHQKDKALVVLRHLLQIEERYFGKASSSYNKIYTAIEKLDTELKTNTSH